MAYALLFNPITIHFARKEKAALLEEFNPPGARKNSTTCGTLILEEGKKNLSHRLNGRGELVHPQGLEPWTP